jgi:hypothetical protein
MSVIYYFFPPKKYNSDSSSPGPVLEIQKNSQRPTSSFVNVSIPNSKLAERIPVVLPNKDEKENKSEKIEPALAKNDYVKVTRKNPGLLAYEKIRVPIKEELKKAVAIKTLSKEEFEVTGIYSGQVSINNQKYLVKLNLLVNGNYGLQPGSCISMYDSRNLLFKEFYGDGRMTFMRMPEKQYFIIAIKDQYYFQVFIKQTATGKALTTHLIPKGQQAPFIFELNFIGGPPDRCEL